MSSDRITPEASGVWRLRATIREKAVSKDNRFFIPSFDTGKIYNSEYIAVGIQVKNSRENWRFGGYLSQEYKFKSTGYKNSGKAFFRSQDLLINEVSIIKLPLLVDGNYRLRFFPATYFTEVRLQIWEYEGVQIDVLLQDLTSFFRDAPPDLLINLPAIEAKIDRVLANQQTGINVDFSEVNRKLDKLLNCCDGKQSKDNSSYYKQKFGALHLLGFI